jgi:pimeloyl-ACP methyl ester carboxylesterase
MRDPFVRGPHPVGVFSRELSDPGRGGRRIPLELWYPAEDEHLGQDLSPATQDQYPLFGGLKVRQEAVRDARPKEGPHPAVLFSHGFAGHRRQSTFLCSHLASHGYLVVAPDHAGNTLTDMMQLVLKLGASRMPPDPEALLGSYVFDRPRDLSLSIDALARGDLHDRVGGVDLALGVGVVGHSFGGWTSLVLGSREPRVRALVPMAPAGGAGPLWALALERELTFEFPADVETLYLAAQRDSLLPEVGIEQLFRRTPDPVRMLVLENADHMHFCDRVERSHEFFRTMPLVGPFAVVAKRLPPMSELVPGTQGHAFARGLALLHLDAVIKRSAEARSFFAADAVASLGERGIVIREVHRDHRV